MADPSPMLDSASAQEARVAVVGGGWAGLACAVELCAAGRRVCLYESAKQLGGRARRVEAGGRDLDNGQHLLIGAYSETLRLIGVCGGDAERLFVRRPLAIVHPVAGFSLRLPRLPAPLHLAAGLLAAKGAAPGEKLAAVRLVRALRGEKRRADGIGVAEWLDRHGVTGNLRRRLWEPLCLAALNTAPENASARIFANVLREALGGPRANSDLLLPRVDLSRVFPDPAARFITANGGEIRLSRRVESIGTPLAIDGEHFSDVVIAAAPPRAADLLRGHEETRGLAALLESYDYEPIATAYLAYPEDPRLPFPMLGLPGPVGQWAFARQGSFETGIVAFVLSARGAWENVDDADLAARLHEELQQALGRALPAPEWRQVIRERRATFSCRPDFIRPLPETGRPGLWLAGDYVCPGYPATLEAAVRSGVAVARNLLQHGEHGDTETTEKGKTLNQNH